MRKLLLNLFLSTVGLLFAGQASAQEEIAPGIIKRIRAILGII